MLRVEWLISLVSVYGVDIVTANVCNRFGHHACKRIKLCDKLMCYIILTLQLRKKIYEQ